MPGRAAGAGGEEERERALPGVQRAGLGGEVQAADGGERRGRGQVGHHQRHLARCAAPPRRPRGSRRACACGRRRGGRDRGRRGCRRRAAARRTRPGCSQSTGPVSRAAARSAKTARAGPAASCARARASATPGASASSEAAGAWRVCSMMFAGCSQTSREGSSSGEDARLLLGELLGGEDAGGVQLGELLQPGDGLVAEAAGAPGGGAAGAGAAAAAAAAAARRRPGGPATLPETAVAVPAMTAVRAAVWAARPIRLGRPRRDPNMGVSFGQSATARSEAWASVITCVGDALGEDELAPGGADGLRRSGWPRRARRGGRRRWCRGRGRRRAPAGRPRRGGSLISPVSFTKAAATSGPSSWVSRMETAPSGGLADHRHVDQPHEALVEEVVERGDDVAGEAVAVEADDDVFDRAEGGGGSGMGGSLRRARDTAGRRAASRVSLRPARGRRRRRGGCGCRAVCGVSKMARASPASTTSPFCMTTTLWASARTTRRSWETKM